jgi:hypothetical protein
MRLSSLPYLLHVPPISLFLILVFDFIVLVPFDRRLCDSAFPGFALSWLAFHLKSEVTPMIYKPFDLMLKYNLETAFDPDLSSYSALHPLQTSRCSVCISPLKFHR